MTSSISVNETRPVDHIGDLHATKKPHTMSSIDPILGNVVVHKATFPNGNPTTSSTLKLMIMFKHLSKLHI